jgi:hypothetical protein
MGMTLYFIYNLIGEKNSIDKKAVFYDDLKKEVV